MNYIITYEDALRICEAYRNFNFYKTEHQIDGYRIVTFNYFMCDYPDFANPLKGEPNIHAFDMRGVTFVFNEDGSLFKRFLMLPKFFNLNQVETTQYNVIKKKKISYVTAKEDGSLVAFMNLPNGKVFAKTQAGFTNEQSVAALEIYNSDEKIKTFIDDALNVGLTPLFEYVAFDNRIVLKYSGRELRLIGVRNSESGRFTSVAKMSIDKTYKIPHIATIKEKSLDKLITTMKSAENVEGVVIEFKDGQLIKIKSDWYFNLHGIRTVHIFREDYIISNYLNETLDDVTQELNMVDDKDAFAFIDEVKDAVNNWSNFIEKNVDELVEKHNSTFYSGHWNKFAMDNSKSKFFGLAKFKIERPNEYRQAKINYMLKMTNKLMHSKKIVETFKTKKS